MHCGRIRPEKLKKIPPAIKIANCMHPLAPPPNSGEVLAIMPIMKNSATA